jgi:hypothetical protein
MKRFAPFCILFALASCATGGGGTVLPSPIGDIAVGEACRKAVPDIIPTSPILARLIYPSDGVGSAADALEPLRMGFTRVSFVVTPEMINDASKLAIGDTSRWSRAPLTSVPGVLTLEVAQKGDRRCAAFEQEVEGQLTSNDPKASRDDPMKYWTDTRFPPAPPEDRNWCLAVTDNDEGTPFVIARDVTTTKEGQSQVSVTRDRITDYLGQTVAQRTIVRMYRASFPVGISQVATGCDGRTIGSTPEFWGPTGIALRPAAGPTLINK